LRYWFERVHCIGHDSFRLESELGKAQLRYKANALLYINDPSFSQMIPHSLSIIMFSTMPSLGPFVVAVIHHLLIQDGRNRFVKAEQCFHAKHPRWRSFRLQFRLQAERGDECGVPSPTPSASSPASVMTLLLTPSGFRHERTP
jgi:hypothetical protein